MPRIPLPDGARAVAQDGTDRYTAGPGDTVNVSPGNAAAVASYTRRGPARGGTVAVGTKRGRRCVPCRRLWNAWTTVCPRCGRPTEQEAPMSMPDPSIAPGVDPDVDVEPAAPDVTLRNLGGDAVVVDVGAWPSGEVRQVPGWLAVRLLQSPAQFAEASDDTPDETPAAEPDATPPLWGAPAPDDEADDTSDTDPAHADH